MLYLSSAYLAPIGYYALLQQQGGACIEQWDHYVKQTYRNRCIIASPSGPLVLSIPVEKPATSKTPMRDIRISEHGNWRRMHWNALEAAYNSSPFFEYYKDDFVPFYERPQGFLVDFNESLCRLVCELIPLRVELSRTTHYRVELDKEDIDGRTLFDAKKTDNRYLTAKPYYQVFEQQLGFLPNLSIVDLLFNMGPESRMVLLNR